MPDVPERHPEIPSWLLASCGLVIGAALVASAEQRSRPLSLGILASMGFGLLLWASALLLRRSRKP